jgi:hypothetical protein
LLLVPASSATKSPPANRPLLDLVVLFVVGFA